MIISRRNDFGTTRYAVLFCISSLKGPAEEYPVSLDTLLSKKYHAADVVFRYNKLENCIKMRRGMNK